MSASLGKRVLKWTLLITPWLLMLLLAVGWGLASWTPGYLEQLIPQLTQEMGIPLKEFHIRHAGLFSADIGPVQLGQDDAALRLNTVSVTYSPASLKLGQVNRIVMQGVNLGCTYDGTTLRLPVLELFAGKEDEKSAKAQSVPELPFETLSIQDSTLTVEYMGKRLAIPFAATLTPGAPLGVEGTLYLRDQAIHFSGELGPTVNDLALTLTTSGFELGSMADLLPMTVSGAVDLDLKASVDLTRPEKLASTVTMTLRNPGLPGSGMTFADRTSLAVNATIAGNALDLTVSPVTLIAPYPVTVAIPEAHISQDRLQATYSLEAVGVNLPGTFSAEKKDGRWSVNLAAANRTKMRVIAGDRTIRLGGFTMNVSGIATAEAVDAVLEVSTEGIGLDAQKIGTGPLRLRLPLAWPPPDKHTPGRLTISAMRFDKYALGSLSVSLRQESMGLGFDGALTTKLLPKLRVPVSGHVSAKDRKATLTFAVDQYALPPGYTAAKLVPALKDITMTGNLNIEGRATVSPAGIDSRLGVFFTDGTATIGTKGTVIKGIRLYFESPDLINFHSAPAQMFAFDTLTSSGITVENCIVTFQVEPKGVILVERGRFNWAGGHVESRALRIVPGRDDYDATLFCTNLRLREILHQLGLAKAEGESALSGELPVTWTNGQLSFNDGFLHSTPGQGGTIQVEAMQELLDSIPKGTPERGQLELARAAIKDFEYKWVRIKADTVGRDLLVRLSVDGKPTRTLPFVYKKEFGGFIMVEGDVQGSNFQGLRLDINFSVPLDRILLYKDLIERIE